MRWKKKPICYADCGSSLAGGLYLYLHNFSASFWFTGEPSGVPSACEGSAVYIPGEIQQTCACIFSLLSSLLSGAIRRAFGAWGLLIKFDIFIT